MTYHKILIKIDPRLRPGTCTLPVYLQSYIRQFRSRKIILYAGSRAVEAVIDSLNDSTPSALNIADDVAEALCLPQGLTLNVLTDEKQPALRLGPFIGIYGHKNLLGRRLFSEQTSYFRKLCQIARDHGALAYVIAPDDLKLQSNYTLGHIFELGSGNGNWQQAVLPLPDVFYDRGLFPRGPNKGKSMKVRRFLRQAWGNKFFNPKFFDKWRTHNWISQNPDLSPYLPETIKVFTWKELLEFMARHSSVYLKPSGGSSGRGIIRVRYQGDSYLCEFFRKKVFYQNKYPSLEALWQDLSEKALLNKTYLVQEDLGLAKYNDRPFDVRALMQKDSSGQWILTGMAARIAGANDITSNLHSGGTAAKIDHVLTKIFDEKTAMKIEKEITGLCYQTCTWVEEVSGLQFGEIAVDIGIKETGSPMLIELNAVPGRTIFSKIKAGDLRHKAVSRPIQYAVYLAGFGSQTNQ